MLDGAAVLEQGDFNRLVVVDMTPGVGARTGVEVAELLALKGRGFAFGA
jgi:hypothetical protein